MKKWLISLAALMISALSAYAQPVPGPGPGPVPGPWVVNGSTISYDGCLTVPRLVTGGCKGNGTGNFGALYVNGVAVSAGGVINPGTAGQLGYYATNGSTISGLTPGNLIQLSKGTSVLDPGTGKLEQVRPVFGYIAASRSWSASDLFTFNARSNSGSTMTDTLPPASTIGLINGTPLIITNADASANLTLNAGAGTTVNGTSSLVLFAGQTVSLLYNFSGTNWVIEYTTYTNLPANRGGTGITSYVIGDILYANSTTSLARLADVAGGNVLRSGGVGAAPSWGKVDLVNHVTGTLTVSNGGTGAASLGQYNILLGNGTSALAGTLLTSGQLLVGQTTFPTAQTMNGDCTLTNTAAITCTKTAGTAFTTAATTAMGTSANNIVQLNGSSQLPAVDGSLLTNINSVWPPGTLYGLTLSQATTSTLGIAAGSARNEDGGTAFNMILSSAFTKGLGAWAVGTGNGSLDTGSIAASTWYYVHLIRRTSDGLIDVLISLSPTSPTMPSGWVARRRIGAFKTDGSSLITAFVQVGDNFMWSAPVMDQSASVSSSAAQLVTLSVPPLVGVLADFEISNDSTTFGYVLVSSPLVPDLAPSSTVAPYFTTISASGNSRGLARLKMNVNGSGQIRYRNTASASTLTNITTYGWTDPRGQN